MKPATEVLRLPTALVEQLRSEARRCYPREACGFLLGGRSGVEAWADRLIPTENRAVRADRFLIEARDVFDAMRAARESGCDLLGVYHSHPDGRPEPSATDRADAWYEWLYVIVSSKGPAPTPPISSLGSAEIEGLDDASGMACFRWDRERFRAVAVRSTHAAAEPKR